MHLLVVEDDARLGPLLARMLREERHVVELTASGVDALEIAAAGSGIDAVVLDIGLPDDRFWRGRDVPAPKARRHGAGPCDRRLDRRAPWWPDHCVEPAGWRCSL